MMDCVYMCKSLSKDIKCYSHSCREQLCALQQWSQITIGALVCFMGIAAAGVMVLDRGDCSRVVYRCLSCMGTDNYEMVRIQSSLCSLH